MVLGGITAPVIGRSCLFATMGLIDGWVRIATILGECYSLETQRPMWWRLYRLSQPVLICKALVMIC